MIAVLSSSGHIHVDAHKQNLDNKLLQEARTVLVVTCHWSIKHMFVQTDEIVAYEQVAKNTVYSTLIQYMLHKPPM